MLNIPRTLGYNLNFHLRGIELTFQPSQSKFQAIGIENYQINVILSINKDKNLFNFRQLHLPIP